MSVVPLWGESRDHAFNVIHPSVWEGRQPPRRSWMVEDIALKGTVVMLSGDGGKGKSLLMQQLCSSASLGRDWLGLEVVSGRALYLACEDDEDELWRRQAKINDDLLTTMTDVDEGGLFILPRVGLDNQLVWFDRQKWRLQPTGLFQKLWDFCSRQGVQYVVIDTATQTYGGNQNDEIQVMFYITLLRRLAVAIQGVVIITKHPSLTGRSSGTGESGSVTWQNSVRSRIYLHDTPKGLVLKTMKSNYSRLGSEIHLKWQNGVFVRNIPEETYDKRHWDR